MNTRSLFPVSRSLFPVPSSLLPAFTLIELLVVIAIIGILAAVLTVSVSSGGESARAAQCLANMKNLANACQVYGMRTERYPNAAPVEYLKVDTSRGKKDSRTSYHERAGWISWDSSGKFPSTSYTDCSPIGLYCNDKQKATHALTNSCLWTYVSQNTQCYVCPSHVRKYKKKSPPVWSYLMNGYFGWGNASGRAVSQDGCRVRFGHLARADRYLLFSEVPFMGYSSWQPEGTGGSEETDSVLQYDTSVDGVTESGAKGANSAARSGGETIGANHLSGRTLHAHVAFADGHVEKLQIPYTGSTKNPKVDETQLKNLTSWLCTGQDISYDSKSKKYERLEK